MKKLVWNADGKPVLVGQITMITGYSQEVASIDNGVLKVRYSSDGLGVAVPAGVIGARWVVETAMFESAPGDWPEDFEHENGQYQNVCEKCKTLFMGNKRRFYCKTCSTVPDEVVVNIPTMRSMDLYQHFQNFRYAEVTVRGLGPAYQNAVTFIDEQVRIRVAEILKGMS